MFDKVPPYFNDERERLPSMEVLRYIVKVYELDPNAKVFRGIVVSPALPLDKCEIFYENHPAP